MTHATFNNRPHGIELTRGEIETLIGVLINHQHFFNTAQIAELRKKFEDEIAIKA